MRPQDMAKFQATLASLAEVFGKQLSPQLVDLYWDALKSMAIEQLVAGSQSWVRFGKHFPKPAELLERSREMEGAKAKPAYQLPPPDRKWLCLVNAMFLQYLSKRRLAEKFDGDIDILARRRECIALADFFEGIEAEGDPEATEAEMKIRFTKAMDRIPDKTQTRDWLPVELERQRQEDKERDARATA